ncbi:MAG: hypothetical protein H6662_01050 [Ardenticatenaceae bacterium]|nr:hypothetical protein [Anaerolineales bacterium]MCB8920142.1 hypothetical protein [Ardenticatenaceae bacterium]MCB9005063.1 hypothetical protein [Ardenticatenaceae bacterium]
MTFLLIPYTRLTLKTYLSAPEAERRLALRVRPRSWLQVRSFWAKKDLAHDFVGKVEDGRFNINRIIYYRNSFLPIIIGQFHEDLGDTRIEITMRLHYLVLAFLAVWLIIFFSFIGGGLSENSVPISLFVGFIVLFLAIVLISFNYEANKARRMLEELWTAD